MTFCKCIYTMRPYFTGISYAESCFIHAIISSITGVEIEPVLARRCLRHVQPGTWPLEVQTVTNLSRSISSMQAGALYHSMQTFKVAKGQRYNGSNGLFEVKAEGVRGVLRESRHKAASQVSSPTTVGLGEGWNRQLGLIRGLS